MNLEEIQKQVDDWVSQFNPPYWPHFEQLAHLMEETGELSRELMNMYGIKKKKQEETPRDLGKELSDVLFTIICIANSNGINLQDEWKEMMEKRRYGRDNQRYDRK